MSTWHVEKQLSVFLDGVAYPKNGIKVLKHYSTKEEQKTLGDKRILWNGREGNVDEKAFRQSDYQWCLLEIIQDIPSWDMGWVHDLKDTQWMVVGFFDYFDDKQQKPPSHVYIYDYPRLLAATWDRMKQKDQLARPDQVAIFYTPKGYGITVNLQVPYTFIEKAGNLRKTLWPIGVTP